MVQHCTAIPLRGMEYETLAVMLVFLPVVESTLSLVEEFTMPADMASLRVSLKEPLSEIKELSRSWESPVLSLKELVWRPALRVCRATGWVTEKFSVVVWLSCTPSGFPLAALVITEVFSTVLFRRSIFASVVCVCSVVVLAGSASRLSEYLLRATVKVVQSAGKTPSSASITWRSEITDGLAKE